MKPFFNLGCALVAWTALARLAAVRQTDRDLWRLPMAAFRQGRHAQQLTYLQSPAALNGYHALIVEPLLLLNRQQDGGWQLLQAAEQEIVNQILRRQVAALLQAWPIALTDVATAGVLRLRIAVAARQSRIAQDSQPLSSSHVALQLPCMASNIEPYLQLVSSVSQLEDAMGRGVVAGGVTMQSQAEAAAGDEDDGWRQLLIQDWSPLLRQQLTPAARRGAASPAQ
ncbi:DUF3313 domain-containing protein [Chromobacterium haemolyticum]|uniref:DUF3313 domain-containing protein n=1 Tax=Chromobacterium fluminis TaxID=3044269 RepID=A0ABX0KWM7_9NEIS|nr:DUF3313 family protein [Chromobacterium haemolyticum]NHR03922.1 DUF3313 domain-containing protein [Chromobacterium haemolyticum]